MPIFIALARGRKRLGVHDHIIPTDLLEVALFIATDFGAEINALARFGEIGTNRMER